MNKPLITSTPPDRREQSQSQDDVFLSQFDDEDLERALKTVSCNAKDVSQFLRAAAYV
jgi:hypothetical protein